jgi:hypothetical protein
MWFITPLLIVDRGKSRLAADVENRKANEDCDDWDDVSEIGTAK